MIKKILTTNTFSAKALRCLLLSLCFLLIINCSPSTGGDISSSPVEQTEPTNDPDHPSLIYKVLMPAKYFTVDKLNQLYLVTERNEVIKYDINGTEVFRYNNNFLENLTHVDVTDPFNILLYYPDYLTAITVDRTLSQVGEFNLTTLDFNKIQAIGTSNDGNIWLYDDLGFKLKKISKNGTLLRESVDLSLQLNYAPKPTFVMERENDVYLNDPEYGIIIFNIFGEYNSTLNNLKGIDRFQIFDNRLVYKKEKEIITYHLQSLDSKILKLPVELSASDDAMIQKNRLYVSNDSGLFVYQIEG